MTSFLDDMQTSIGEAFADDFYPAAIARPGSIGGTDWNPSSGQPTEVDGTGLGIVLAYTTYELANTTATEQDRKIILLGYKLTLVPAPGDVITIRGSSYRVSDKIEADPALATYTIMGRLL